MGCAVGKFMKRWKLQKDSACPRCEEHEDAPHAWKCNGDGTQDTLETALDQLKGWFNSMQKDPDLQYNILKYLRSWQNDIELPQLTIF